MPRKFTHHDAKVFYDRFGAKQDTQKWYEDPALDLLCTYGRFESAHAVFEFGCGTGRFAARLLTEQLPTDCRYLGVDISSTMVELAQRRLEPWSSRASVRLSEGSVRCAEPDASFDRYVSTYVLDLLTEEDIQQSFAEAHRLLSRDGLLCLASLTYGTGPLSRLVSWGWTRIRAIKPRLVGGCRPIRFLDFVCDDSWKVEYRDLVCRFGICSEVLIASPR